MLDPIEEDGRDGIDESDFNLKYDENQRDQIEADVEVNPGAPGRRLAAFVRSQLTSIRIVRRQQLLQPEHQRHEADRDDGEREGYAKIEDTCDVTESSLVGLD